MKRLVDDERQVIARDCLREGEVSIRALAAQLGYTDTKSLLRASKRWTGTSPSRFRAHMPDALITVRQETAA